MKLRPRVHADHQVIVSTLAFLALDRPAFDDVLRGIVVTLYGLRAAAAYEAVQREFDPAPEFARSEKVDSARNGGRTRVELALGGAGDSTF